MGGKLTREGFFVRAAVTVRDDCRDISWALDQAIKRGAKAVITTGGLGPTFDDKTLECVARSLGLELELNQEALEMVRKKYESAGVGLNEPRMKMARMPAGGVPLPNPVGTAPGCMLEIDGVILFSLPGVPSEMKAMFEESVLPTLMDRLSGEEVAQETFRCVGVPESSAAPLISEVMRRVPGVYVKSHPMGSELGAPVLELHVQYRGEGAAARVEEAARLLRDALEGAGGRIG